MSALRSLLYFPSSRIIRKQGAKAGVQTAIPCLIRCKLRYCNATCQHDHWRRGHKQMCKKIHRGGNAEQYHANKKYKEAVAVAVEKCADARAALRAREAP